MPKRKTRPYPARIFVAVIIHREGLTMFSGTTRKALNREVALWVKDWAFDLNDDGKQVLRAIHEGQWENAIESYFDEMHDNGEILEYFDPEVPKSNEGPIRIQARSLG